MTFTKEPAQSDSNTIYDCIIVGAGAAGLFYAGLSRNNIDISGEAAYGSPTSGINCSQNLLILEKTCMPGQKLLMSGNGMCNITHGGSIKEFTCKYGDKGYFIRKCLYRYNNTELIKKLNAAGINTVEREDGKIFPASLKANDVLDILLKNAKAAGWELRCDSEVTGIAISDFPSNATSKDSLTTEDGFVVPNIIELTISAPTDQSLKRSSVNQLIRTKKLVIACGGASYPSTGSDGSFFSVLEQDLGLKIVMPRPALAPVYVQDYSYGELSGISFDHVRISCQDDNDKTRIAEGSMLLTHKGFSGPAMLHISQYVRPGTVICANYLSGENAESLKEKIRSGRKGNTSSSTNYITDITGLPKAFIQQIISESARASSSDGSSHMKSEHGIACMDIRNKNAADLSNKDIDILIRLLTCHPYSVSGTGGFNNAMATAGGADLKQIDAENMQIKRFILSSDKNDTFGKSVATDIRIIGEALDVNGDTGGYNLQFAYSSAMAAHLPAKLFCHK